MSPGRTTQRILYFDIDGVLVDYEDQVKPALAGGALEDILKANRFEHLICVSNWAAMAQEPSLRIPAEERPAWVYRRFAPVFPDKDWFLARTSLATDTDNRAQSIDLSQDWYYVDDWADEYFTKTHGEHAYHTHKDHRILLANPFGDGGDIIDWIKRVTSV